MEGKAGISKHMDPGPASAAGVVGRGYGGAVARCLLTVHSQPLQPPAGPPHSSLLNLPPLGSQPFFHPRLIPECVQKCQPQRACLCRGPSPDQCTSCLTGDSLGGWHAT